MTTREHAHDVIYRISQSDMKLQHAKDFRQYHKVYAPKQLKTGDQLPVSVTHRLNHRFGRETCRKPFLNMGHMMMNH